jgi:ABC-type amino acid transport substrate-binding protein
MMNKKTLFLTVFCAAALAVFMNACSTGSTVRRSEPARENTLKVGITPDYPPLVFKQGGTAVGVEVDFAHILAGELGLPLRLVELQWDELIPALLDGRIDIIMSGMSITQGRKVRITFCAPYYEVGQMALIRQSDANQLGTAQQIMDSTARIGIIRDTTGDVFVQRHCPAARRVGYSQPKDAAWDLGINRKRIDVFIYDDPAIKWFASANEADLAVVPTPFTREYLAWGVRRNDTHLLDDLNRILEKWQQDGTLDRIIKRWIP